MIRMCWACRLAVRDLPGEAGCVLPPALLRLRINLAAPWGACLFRDLPGGCPVAGRDRPPAGTSVA